VGANVNPGFDLAGRQPAHKACGADSQKLRKWLVFGRHLDS
jgi:hypothetical protein